MPKTFEIHPSIGIARVGNSIDQFFMGPEPGVASPQKYRDDSGRYKRQAARFRVFECERDGKGNLLNATELTPAKGQISWTVHLANRKAAAPNFNGTGSRNNATGNDDTDKDLIINPGPRTLAGIKQGPALFDTGKFKTVAVPLGSIQTDEAGRLIVLGGFGTSNSVPSDPQLPITDFADNDGWFDDVSDGPVRATIKLTGASQTVEAKPAWVIVATPDFAPDIFNLITLYDVAFQVAVEKGQRTAPQKPSFVRHIQPILRRAVGYQWVNEAGQGHAAGRPGGFDKMWPKLANPATSGPLAKGILRRLRDPNQPPPPEPVSQMAMPRLHDETNSSQVLPLTKSQYAALQQWAAGKYVNDLGQASPPELVPDALDRMALEACAGGPFFPGIEAGRIMKDKDNYVEPFRLNADRLKPGQITQGSALPWQADFFDCTYEAHGKIGWWPAQRPDHVLRESDPTKYKEWVRGIGGKQAMTRDWHHLGIVVRKAGPPEIFVETERDPAFLPK